jgi:4-hydroxybenzoate polyprenyltransferase
LKSTLLKTGYLVLQSNILIACCSVTQALLTYRLLAQPPSKVVLSVLFLATLFIYNIRWVLKDAWLEKKQGIAFTIDWKTQHRFVWILSIGSLLAIIPLACLLKDITCWVLAFTAVFALLYSMPVIPYGKGTLRQIPVLKTLLIGWVWGLSTVMVPVVDSGVCLETLYIFNLFLRCFIVVSVLAVLSDIGDLEADKKNHLITIPKLVGVGLSRYLCALLLCLNLGLAYVYPVEEYMFFAFLLFMLLALLVVSFADTNRHRLYYMVLVDGMLMVQYLLVLVMGYVKP